MTNAIFVVAVLLQLLVLRVGAQQERRNSTFSLQFGGNHIWNKDAFQSPYTYTGFNSLVFASFRNVQVRGEHNINLMFSTGKTRSVVAPYASQQLAFLSYDYSFNNKPAKVNRRLGFYLGIGLQTFISSTNYLPKFEPGLKYYSAAAFLSPSIRAAYRLNSTSHLKMQAGLAAFGFAYRPDFEINGKTLTRPTLPPESILMSASLAYVVELSPKFGLTANYQVNYFTFEKPRPVVILQGGLSLGATYKF